MSLLPFTAQAGCRRCPPLAEFLLALAAEFDPVDPDPAEAALDALGSDLYEAALRAPRGALRAVGELIGDRFEAEAPAALRRRGLMLDRVLARGAGHPVLIATIAAEAGNRAGIPLLCVADCDGVYVAHAGLAEPLVLDPARPAAGLLHAGELNGTVLRRCPHQLASIVLDELVARGCRGGDLATALKRHSCGWRCRWSPRR